MYSNTFERDGFKRKKTLKKFCCILDQWNYADWLKNIDTKL